MEYSIGKIIFDLSENGIESAKAHMAAYVPNYLMKFYSLTEDDNLNMEKIETLANNRNWFSSKQNDPFDRKMFYLDEVAVRDLGTELFELEKQFINRMADISICSFSDVEYKNLPMWAYYANNHQGYCVNYRVLNKGCFFKVGYEESRLGFKTLITKLLAVYTLDGDNRIGKMGRAECVQLLFLLLSIKHVSWKHENEYRVFWKIDNNRGMRVQNNEVGIAIEDITIGLNCKKHYEKNLMAVAQNLSVPCYKVQIEDEHFLTRIRIE